jgi:type II secretory pathway component PulL
MDGTQRAVMNTLYAVARTVLLDAVRALPDGDLVIEPSDWTSSRSCLKPMIALGYPQTRALAASK